MKELKKAHEKKNREGNGDERQVDKLFWLDIDSMDKLNVFAEPSFRSLFFPHL